MILLLLTEKLQTLRAEDARMLMLIEGRGELFVTFEKING